MTEQARSVEAPPHLALTLVPITNIVVKPGRTRQSFNERQVENLACSIYSVGLINAIVLEDDTLNLSSGERRLRAITLLSECGLTFKHRGQEISPGFVPVIEHWADNDLERLQVEVDENLEREDLTWQERAIAEARLHELRVMQHGRYTPGIAGIDEDINISGWSYADTAAELSGDRRSRTGQPGKDIADSVSLADFMDDPLVANAKSKKDAVKIVKDIRKAQEREKRAAAILLNDLPHKLHKGSYLDAPIEPHSIDVFVIDPPYGRNMHKQKFGTNHKYDDSDEWWQEHIVGGLLPNRLTELASEKPGAHAYIFCDFLRFTDLLVQMEVAGWTCLRRPIIWDKGHIGSYGNYEYEPRHVYDCILHARRGDRPFILMDRDVIDDIEYIPERLDHPAGKPHDLYANLLRRSVNPGDTVADLMCGGGSIFPAAHSVKCIAHGVELSDEYYAMATLTLGDLRL